jgi:hypothetical protein
MLRQCRQIVVVCWVSIAGCLAAGCLAAGCSADTAPKKSDTPVKPTPSSANQEHPPSGEVAPTMTDTVSVLGRYTALRGLDRPAIIDKLEAKPEHIREHAAYERLSDVTEVHQPAADPARFFFQGDKLVMIYLGDRTLLGTLTEDQLKAELGGGPGESLMSRAGKQSEMLVYPDKGVAFSIGDEIDFLEIFPPCTLAEYQANIYSEPGPFYK